MGEESGQGYEGTAPSSFQEYSGWREGPQSQQSSIENHMLFRYLLMDDEGIMNH